MKVKHISASGIKTYEQCPLKYYAIYDLEMPEPPPHPNTVMGSAVHEMMEAATNCRIAKDPDPVHHDPLFFKKATVENLKVERNLWGTIDELVGNAVQWGYFRNIHRTAGCELKIGFKLPDQTEVTGYIDRLDLMLPDADIIDLKTQKNAFSDEELAHNWQARIYNIGARRLYPELTGKATVSFWVLRHQVQRVWLTAEDAERDYQLLADKVTEIKTCTDPQPCPTALCPWCPYQNKCPTNGENARSRLKRMTRR